MEELISQLNDLPTGTIEVRAADAQQTSAVPGLPPCDCNHCTCECTSCTCLCPCGSSCGTHCG
ncbi:hypothetical protein [Actinomadura oligospora]|uniref:hypothetical protein n=1 Tax=Actinomadura oligospora TaxID=111804 RepID=UPI0012FBC58E|nr:hypothetical protein [Actinomadura oligospora]